MGKAAAKKVVKKAAAKKVLKKIAKKGAAKKVVKKAAKKVVKKAAAKKTPAKCNVSKNGRCGPQYGNTICPAGYCSQWWWCGTSALHKSTHQAKYDAKPACAAKKDCTSFKLSNNGRCGPQFGKTYCKSGFCSRWSWCGPGAPASDKNRQKWEDH